MCGITATVGLADERVIKAMTDAIAHRGPDDQGIWVDATGPVALGHRRLSIIDLSPAGHQPMSYAGGRYWIAFNGEIYNYQALRAELEQRGHCFRSGSDTEVILAAYAEWGERCVERLRGMFAFALYDRGPGAIEGQPAVGDEAQLFLARDRFGIKPLYYAEANGVRLFASELKALLASGLVSRQTDTQALWDYLALGSVPQPRTLLAGVQALPAGHTMTVPLRGEPCIRRYWDVVENAMAAAPTVRKLGRVDASRELRRLLEEATRLHMIADVPVGAFLSGGIDSTSIVGLMSQHVSKPLRTYSVGFESRHQRLSELQWAKIAAERFHTEHTEVVVTGEQVAAEYDRLVDAIDQPSLDGTNTYFVSKATRAGVTVSLSGLGGDELFAGYPHFRWFRQIEAWDRLPIGRSAKRPILRALRGRYAPPAHFLGKSLLERHATIRCLAGEAERRQMTAAALQGRGPLQPLTGLYERLLPAGLDVVSQVSAVELRGYLCHTLLRDADAMSMAHALEVRPVLLDHVLAEFAMAMAPERKLDGRTAKLAFVDAVRDLLPEPIVTRPKRGFEMPLFQWLAGPLRERALGVLASPCAASVFGRDYLMQARAWLQSPQQEHVPLWAHVLLIEWLQRYRCEL